MANLTDAQFAAFIDRILECRKREDEAKEDTKLVYAELADAGGDKAAAGALIRSLRMDEKQAGKAQLREALVEEYRGRYQRGKASHVRAREGSYSEAKGRGIPTHDSVGNKLPTPSEWRAKDEITDNQKLDQPKEAVGVAPAVGVSDETAAPAGVDTSAPATNPTLPHPGADDGQPSEPKTDARPGGEALAPHRKGQSVQSVTNPHSQASPRPADTAGEVHSSSRTSPANNVDYDKLEIPDFLKCTDGYPKREAVEA